MKIGKWLLVVLAFAAVAAMTGVGVAVGERSVIGAVISAFALMMIMGYGFKTRKALREKGIL